MKRIISVLLVTVSLLNLTGCSVFQSVDKTIEIKEMREIAELATVECYFHNVAKSDKPLNPAWYEIWKKKNMRFWVEYDGVVTIGIDASKLKVTVNDDVVTITLPEPIVLDAKVDPESLGPDSFYYDPNAEKPDADEQSEAFELAQDDMIAAAESNYALMVNAQENAKELLGNYVESVGNAVNIEYSIQWEMLNDEN